MGLTHFMCSVLRVFNGINPCIELNRAAASLSLNV